MTKKDLNHIENLRAWALRHGYKKSSRTDAYEKELPGGGKLRLKFNKTSLRMEKQIRYTDGISDWVRIRSGYYKNIGITPENDKLGGLR